MKGSAEPGLFGNFMRQTLESFDGIVMAITMVVVLLVTTVFAVR